MAKLFDANGNEVEAFTPEELKAKQEEAVAEHLKNNPDKSDEINKLKIELEAATKKLTDAENGGMNEGQKARLKADKEAAEAKLAETVTTLTKEMSDLKETFTGNIKNKVLNALSKNDPDIKAKIELKYSSLIKTGDYKLDEAGITQAMSEAALLVTKKPVPNFTDNITGAGDRGSEQDYKGNTPESENSKAMRQALGIKDADAAKYTEQVKN